MATLINLPSCSYYYLQLPEEGHIAPAAPGRTIRIAFGSCYDQARSTSIWETIQNSSPDLFIWTGDIIYPDRPIPWPGNNIEKIEHKYAYVKSSESYADFIRQVPVIGIYDDHDFGANNGGKNYKWRRESQQHLLNFLSEPTQSERRKRKGAYTSYMLRSSECFIKIIILDTRYNRDDPGINSDILGEDQWKWLTQELQNNIAGATFIVSSVSVLSLDKTFEGWIHYPGARKRLLELLVQYPQKNLLLLSGDKHFAELNALTYNGYLLHEFISSGLTHSERPGRNYKNVVDESLNYFGINYGIIELDKLHSDGMLLKVNDQQGKTVIQKRITSSELTSALQN